MFISRKKFDRLTRELQYAEKRLHEIEFTGSVIRYDDHCQEVDKLNSEISGLLKENERKDNLIIEAERTSYTEGYKNGYRDGYAGSKP